MVYNYTYSMRTRVRREVLLAPFLLSYGSPSSATPVENRTAFRGVRADETEESSSETERMVGLVGTDRLEAENNFDMLKCNLEENCEAPNALLFDRGVEGVDEEGRLDRDASDADGVRGTERPPPLE